MFLRSIVTMVVLAFTVQSFAARNTTKGGVENFSELGIYMPSEEQMIEATREIPKASMGKRKLAQSQEWTEFDFKKNPDMVEFREAFLSAKTPDDFEALLVKAEADWAKDKWANYSPDKKYFVANILVIKPMRGIVWKLRPLFEAGGVFSGSRATHGSAVHMLRQLATGIDTFFPTDQWKAGFDYVTQPSKQMAIKDQIKTVAEFQLFLNKSFVPAMIEASNRSLALVADGVQPTLVFDRKMIYGTGNFEDNAKRFVGYGPAEIYFSASMLQRGIHDAMVFQAYNQNDLFNIMGAIGKRFGIDSALNVKDMGMTAEQRNDIVMNSVRRTNFLTLRNYDPKNPAKGFGAETMASAYGYLKMSVLNQKKAYDILSTDKTRNDSFILNPIHFQEQSAPKLEKGVNQMVAAISGKATVHDLVSGDKITLDLPAFYLKPYPKLSVLMANRWDKRLPAETVMTNTIGEKLTYRNYDFGRSIGWSNSSEAWGKVVPSAVGESADYMLKAKRVINYSVGTPLIAGEIGLFVR